MEGKQRITDRYTANASDFDQIVIDTFKIIEEKDRAIKELASALDELIVDFWGSTGKGDPYDKCRALANKYLDKD